MAIEDPQRLLAHISYGEETIIFRIPVCLKDWGRGSFVGTFDVSDNERLAPNLVYFIEFEDGRSASIQVSHPFKNKPNYTKFVLPKTALVQSSPLDNTQ